MAILRRGLDVRNDPDTIRILVTTDTHVGVHEGSHIRGDDSWKTFEEVMALATEHDVDMVLHGGDFYHRNQPSKKSVNEVTRILRERCMGDRPCQLEVLGDPREALAPPIDRHNFEDPNINISLPLYVINGNHDDPNGNHFLSPLHQHHQARQVNYFGCPQQSDKIEVKPLLFSKGRSMLALYGMSNIRDARLYHSFRDGHATFFRPSERQDAWFNLLVVHQNRVAHDPDVYLPEEFLPSFLDLVVWGHEHECQITPKMNEVKGFHVMQPGSSVATSLMPGEMAAKHVAILSINNRYRQEFEVTPLELKTVRPFIYKEIALANALANVPREDCDRKMITQHLMSVVENMLDEVNRQWRAGHAAPPDGGQPVDPPLPLVRLRVEFTDPDGDSFECENPQRISNHFNKKVANVNDVVQFFRKKAAPQHRQSDDFAMPDQADLSQEETDDGVVLDALVRRYLLEQRMEILDASLVADAIGQFSNNDDSEALTTCVSGAAEAYFSHRRVADAADEDSEEDDEWVDELPPSARGRGHGRADRTSTKSPIVTMGRGKNRVQEDLYGDEDDETMPTRFDDDYNDDDDDNNNAEDKGGPSVAETSLFVGRRLPAERTTAKHKFPVATRSSKTTRKGRLTGSAANKTSAWTASRQTRLNFAQTPHRLSSQTGTGVHPTRRPLSDNEKSDHDDAFDPLVFPRAR